MTKPNLRGRRWPKIIVIALVTIVLMAGLAVFMVRRAYYEGLKPISANQRGQLVTIPLGYSLDQIINLLHSQELLRSKWAFKVYVNNNGAQDKLQAGTYTLRQNQSVQDIVATITQGLVTTDLVTILPGQRIDQIHSSLMKSGFSELAVDNALNPNNYKNHPALVDKPAGASLEGYLYPESFQKTSETKPEDIIKASLDEMQKNLPPAIRTALVQQGLTVHQGVILASIVEQEVSNADDKPKVAQVFLKRLREGRRLESDATAPYGAIIANQAPSLSFDSPYNTYNNPGLTPTPISNVSGASLRAVASPTATDWLYFVSGDDGVTYFSRTLEEHQALIRQHCSRLCKQP